MRREIGNVLCDRELAEVVADHFGLDFHLVELLAGVDADDAADHLGDDDHVAEVRLDEVGLLVGLGLLLGLPEFLDQAHGLPLEAPVDPAAGTGVDDIAELIGAEVEEAVDGRVSYVSSSKASGPSISFVEIRAGRRGGGAAHGSFFWQRVSRIGNVKTYASRSIPR